jgi:2'-5' RNA ligase
MGEPSGGHVRDTANPGDLKHFRQVGRLGNHWARPASPPSYYWYLTFEDSPELQSLAWHCQQAIRFPYYDLTPADQLHLTLDRIAFAGEITEDQLAAIEAAAILACQQIPPLDVTIGSLGGTRSAIGFAALPAEPIQHLRDVFRDATLSVCPRAPVRHADFHPHVAIAYCNSEDVPAADAVAAVEKLRPTASVDVTVRQGVMVLLDRQLRSYSWRTVFRVRLRG